MKSLITSVLALLVAFASSGSAVELCPSTDKNLEWSSSCFEGNGRVRKVKSEHVRKIVANEAGSTTIMISHPRELVAVNRRGVVTIPNISHAGDFDYPNAPGGLGRFRFPQDRHKGESNDKCGYFDNRTLQITIPATYDHCQPFKDGVAIVCNECVSYCTEPECQHSVLVGGRGFTIDSTSKILGQFTLPPFAEACAGGMPEKVEVAGTISYIRCPRSANSPFGKLQ